MSENNLSAIEVNYSSELHELSKIFQEMTNGVIWSIQEIRKLRKEVDYLTQKLEKPCHTEDADVSQKSENSTRYPEVE